MEWKSVKGYEGFYEVSEDGQVRRIKGRQGKLPAIIKPFKKHDNGEYTYNQVRLTCMELGKREIAAVHRLVAMAFLPNPLNLRCVNHKDFNPKNNHYSNLEWCTQRYNVQYSRKAGRYADNYWKGKRSPNAKLNEQQVADIKALYETRQISQEALSKQFGISKRTIWRIVNGLSYN